MAPRGGNAINKSRPRNDMSDKISRQRHQNRYYKHTPYAQEDRTKHDHVEEGKDLNQPLEMKNMFEMKNTLNGINNR